MCAIILKLCFVLGILLAGTPAAAPTPVQTKVEVPAYAKWSRLAIKQTMLKYPLADIKDYLHMASQTNEGQSIEKFRLWLKEGDREFAVIVTVTSSTETGKLEHIEFQELHFG